MNSEPWNDSLQEIWQRQPPPARERDEERLLRQVQIAEKAWERETGKNDRVIYAIAAVAIVPRLLKLWRAEEVWLGDWLLAIIFGSLVTFVALFGWRRAQHDRDFSRSLLGRTDRGRALLRLRMKFLDLNLLYTPLLALAVGLWFYKWTYGSTALAVAAGALSFVPLAWWLVSHRRTQRAKITASLASLEELRRELTSGELEC